MRLRNTNPVLKVVPMDQETDVPRDATVLVSASRPLDQKSTSGVQVRIEGREVEGVIDISSDGRVLFWNPKYVLDPGAEHHVTISGVRDDRGASFADHTSRFTTRML